MSKNYMQILIREAIRQAMLTEQDMPPGGPPAPAPPPPPPPAAPPAGPEGAPPVGDPTAGPGVQDQLDATPGGITVDKVVERMNIIRSGKSLTEPEVYGKMRALVNGMSQEQKTMLDFVLQEIEKVVAKVNPLQGQAGGVPLPAEAGGGITTPPPPGGAGPGAAPPPPPAAGGSVPPPPPAPPEEELPPMPPV